MDYHGLSVCLHVSDYVSVAAMLLPIAFCKFCYKISLDSLFKLKNNFGFKCYNNNIYNSIVSLYIVAKGANLSLNI